MPAICEARACTSLKKLTKELTAANACHSFSELPP
jgi:hypothetical protein